MNITVEIPFFSKNCGGILRHTQLAKKICCSISGGIKHMTDLGTNLSKKYNVHLRIQRIDLELGTKLLQFEYPFSVGLPDHTFPKSDIVITYSDNPYTKQLINLPQVGKVLIYMLSYGMCIEREKKNILMNNITVMTSTVRTKKLIEAEGITCHNIGFGFENKSFFIDTSVKKEKYAALLFHHSIDKRYRMGVEICEKLLAENLIDGVMTFGEERDYKNFKHPTKLITHISNATPEKVKEIFNKCSVFIMPSVSEGLNLTPIESTLCGCPSVICDGAINDIFFDGKTCFISKKDDLESIFENSKELLLNPIYSIIFKSNIESLLQQFTWEKTISNIENLIN